MGDSGQAARAVHALARHVFAFRMAMIALCAPVALGRAGTPAHTWLVAGVVLVTFVTAYACFRDWERIGPLLPTRPWIPTLDLLLAVPLLAATGPESPLGLVAATVPLLSGLLHGLRPAAVHAGLQVVVVTALPHTPDTGLGTGLGLIVLPGMCVLAGAVGVCLRALLFRVDAANRALLDTRARLAAAEERARLAREMHDSVAKTLHGLALGADALAAGVDRLDPAGVRARADQLAAAARQAAGESRTLLTDLRTPPTPGPLHAELHALTATFGTRTGLPVTTHLPPAPDLARLTLPAATVTELTAIVAEALENVHRHAHAPTATLTVTLTGPPAAPAPTLTLTVTDTGRGLPPPPPASAAGAARHGLLGMAERAAHIGAHLHVGPRPAAPGTEVRLTLPLREETAP
ncbi:sensor histidine kinase [Streptomyces sp. BI20]|uniref:sensor histidine kinase n=1 Tax=Streptomyces sp. BI20 TaxID=3403460 RepID=UPI003C7547C6